MRIIHNPEHAERQSAMAGPRKQKWSLVDMNATNVSVHEPSPVPHPVIYTYQTLFAYQIYPALPLRFLSFQFHPCSPQQPTTSKEGTLPLALERRSVSCD